MALINCSLSSKDAILLASSSALFSCEITVVGFDDNEEKAEREVIS